MRLTYFKQIIVCSVCACLSMDTVFAQKNIGEQVEIDWRTSSQYNGRDNLGLKLILKNTSNSPVDLKSWDLWFNSMFPVVPRKTGNYQFTDHTGNLFKLSFTNQVINPKDSLVFDYQTQFPIVNISTAPVGFYFQDKADINIYYAVTNVVYQPIVAPIEQQTQLNAALYDKNHRVNKVSDYPLIFPSPKSIVKGAGAYPIKGATTYIVDKAFACSDFLVKEIQTVFGTSLKASTANTASLRIMKKNELGVEAYNLTIDKDGISIEASTEKGVFYAIQSLKSMLPAQKSTTYATLNLPFVKVIDEPRFGYRGFMLDIVRNYRDIDVIKKYLDAMAAYKLNVFHFHLIDDEGWRVEIPSLPELTEVGSKRSPSYANGNSIFPAYGSGAIDVKPLHLSRSEFIEILKYANDRFIKVIPEIETPGHSRAAIKAMETRYHRLKALGKLKEAEQYLLHDFEDTSIYNSAQNFNDNVMNPALPSVYVFINKVLDEFKSMYKDAGVEFTTVSLGGDEVPNGVWEKSPKIAQLMKDKGFTSVNQVWPYYIERINDICKYKGLVLAGWEEIGMVNQGKGMVVNADMHDKSNMLLDVWNNVIGEGQEDLAYRLANAGYPTVLISASNLYFDMKWNTNFMEPGLNWATHADLYHSYSLLPEAFFANIDTYYRAKAVGKEGFKSRVRLTEEGKRNLKGIKGGLFAETVHTEAKLDYMVFPRFFSLAEIAWSPERDYENEQTFTTSSFDKDYSRFLNRIAKVDLPKMTDAFDFRLPAVGVKQVDGVILANLEYPGFDIYYTTDGTAPTSKSAKYDPKKGVKASAGKKYAFAVINSKGTVGQLTFFN